MPVVGRFQPEQRLQQAVNMARLEQILAAGDQAYPLDVVVHRHREVVAGRRVLPRQHHVAEDFRPGLDPAALAILPGERAGYPGGTRGVEAERVALPGRDPFACVGAPAAGSGIDRTVRPVRRRAGARDLRPDLRAGAETGVDQPEPVEGGQRRRVVVHMLGLAPDSRLPAEAEPVEVFVDRRLEFGAAAAAIDILDPEQEFSAVRGVRVRVREQRRVSVAEMQEPARARGEAGDGVARSAFCHGRGSMP